MTNNKIVFYGAGKKGQEYMKCLYALGYQDYIYAFCDKNANKIKTVLQKPVLLPNEILQEKGIVYIITPLNKIYREEIHTKLSGKPYYDIKDFFEFLEVISMLLHLNRSKFIREYCAYYHVENMDKYFELAESDENINVFWDKDSPFYNSFLQLDTKAIIELACGRGRHVPKYIDSANKILLVDILQKNIDYCKERFKKFGDKIEYYKNEGFDLKQIDSESYSALFCYDAMVHFELMDIYLYLNDVYRVLIPGGKALFHHSNNFLDYRASFGSTLHSRSYMSKDIFAYLAYRSGFKIISQEIIDWSGYKDLDCITLLEK